MKKRIGKRAIAMVMAVLMFVGVMPMDWTGVDFFKAAETTTYTFDCTELTATADKEVIEAGTFVADDFVKTFGKVTKRWNADKGVTSTEVDKNGNGGYEFTITGTATLKVTISSTGGSNTSAFGVVDASGTAVADSTGATVIEVTGTSKTEFTYSLEAGTYQMISPESSYGRGTRVYKFSIEEVPASVTKTYEFDCTTLTATADKEVIEAGTAVADDFVKTFGKVTKRWNADKGVTSTEVDKNGNGGYEFTITGTATLKVTISSTGGSNTSAFGVVDASGTAVADSTGATVIEVTGTSKTEFTYSLEAGTYQMISPESSYGRGTRVYKFSIEETTGGERPARADWSTVAAPVITDVTVDEGDIKVAYEAVVGYDGADAVVITMTDANGNADSEKITSTSTEGTVEFTPSASGKYTFSITMSRAECEDKKGEDKVVENFVLPLTKANIITVYNKGNGSMAVEWTAVDEATSYIVEYSADGTTWSQSASTADTDAAVSGLTIGKEYTFRVVAIRGEDKTTSAEMKREAKEKEEQKWMFATYGPSTSTSKNGYEGNANDGEVTVYSEGGKGKIQPASTDGLAFYYTAIPSNLNFTLRSKVTVDSWTLSNGQEGFGIMASDRVGESGDSNPFWTNSYMAVATKVEYYYDLALNEVTTSTSASKFSMKLGIAALERIGVTVDNLDKFNANDTNTVNNVFSSTMNTLETSAGQAAAIGEQSYTNVIGNSTVDLGADVTSPNAVTEMYLTIQKNNTGYFVSYEDMDGNVVTQKYYDTDALEKLDADNVYVGFFAARNARVTFTEIELTTIAPENDAPAEERPIEKVPVDTKVTSPVTQGVADYEFTFTANADGTVTITNAAGEVLVKDFAVKANEVCKPATDFLERGKNNYTIVFTPDKDYVPGEYKVMESYEAITINHSVTYRTYGEEGQSLYVAPNGTGDGTKEHPMSIYDAVKFAQPGQTIVIMEGTYLLDKTVRIERGIDGTAEKPIYMVADPEAKTRPVFDFQGKCAGMVFGGNYWVFKGFDVTRSADGQKGVQVSGNYNVLNEINTYYNGNTGIQISRLYSSDTELKDWPSYNLILNCTSYGNADAGYEDADGFAAKLTCGVGNVFDGCIAHHNADDGWDLYAKVQTGSIGAVTIKNSIAYANGYLEDGTNAGNGNGFKMGGESLSGKHVLENCVAYDNKAKGIDSNSCPDIIVKNSITFNNGSYNIALYTNNAANTDYEVTGLISFRTEKLDQAEQLKGKGTQDNAKIQKTGNYYWDATTQTSVDKDGNVVSADWFVSLDTSKVPTRNADGTINMNGLLVLTDKAPETAEGLGTSEVSPTVEVPEAVDPSVIVDGPQKDLADFVGMTDDVKFEDGAVVEEVKVTFAELVETVVATVKAEVEKALEKLEVKAEDAEVVYTDISLTAGGKVVKLAEGKIKITFAWAEGKSNANNDVAVYHYNNGTLERMKVVATDDGFSIETDSFSPYAIVYAAKGTIGDTIINKGDETPYGLYATLMFMGLVSLAGACFYKKRYF